MKKFPASYDRNIIIFILNVLQIKHYYQNYNVLIISLLVTVALTTSPMLMCGILGRGILLWTTESLEMKNLFWSLDHPFLLSA